MAIDDIIQALEQKAESRIESIQSEAEQRVAEIKAEVERDAEHTRRVRMKKAQEAVRSEATAIIYSASLKAKNELIRAQEQTVDEAFQVAEGRLAELNKDESYPKILRVLMDETLEFFDDEVVLQVRAEDRPLVEKMIKDTGQPCRISDTPLEASGGLVGSSPGGEVVVSNTFEARLDRARDKLRLAISNVLFGNGAED